MNSTVTPIHSRLLIPRRMIISPRFIERARSVPLKPDLLYLFNNQETAEIQKKLGLNSLISTEELGKLGVSFLERRIDLEKFRQSLAEARRKPLGEIGRILSKINLRNLPEHDDETSAPEERVVATDELKAFVKKNPSEFQLFSLGAPPRERFFLRAIRPVSEIRKEALLECVSSGDQPAIENLSLRSRLLLRYARAIVGRCGDFDLEEFRRSEFWSNIEKLEVMPSFHENEPPPFFLTLAPTLSVIKAQTLEREFPNIARRIVRIEWGQLQPATTPQKPRPITPQKNRKIVLNPEFFSSVAEVALSPAILAAFNPWEQIAYLLNPTSDSAENRLSQQELSQMGIESGRINIPILLGSLENPALTRKISLCDTDGLSPLDFGQAVVGRLADLEIACLVDSSLWSKVERLEIGRNRTISLIMTPNTTDPYLADLNSILISRPLPLALLDLTKTQVTAEGVKKLAGTRPLEVIQVKPELAQEIRKKPPLLIRLLKTLRIIK